MEQAVAPSAEATPVESTAQESKSTEKTNLEAVVSDVNKDGEDVPRETEKEPSRAEKESEGALKFKRKVNGRWIEASEDELWKHYGLEVSAREKMQQAALQKAEAEKIAQEAKNKEDALAEFFKQMRKNPETAFDLLDRMGHDSRLLARQMVLKELEYERMSDAEKRAYDLERELAGYRAEKLAREELTKQEEQEIENRKIVDNIDQTISESLKLCGLQPRPRTVARLAEACQILLDASDTGELPSPQKITERFLAMQRQDASEIMGEQDPDKLVELGLLTDKSVEKIVKWHLEKNKKNLPSFGQAKASTQQAKEPSNKKIGVKQFFDNLGD